MTFNIIYYGGRVIVIYLILLGIYMAVAYWAANRTIYANAVMFGDLGTIFVRKLVMGTVLGPVLIPVAIIKTFLTK